MERHYKLSTVGLSIYTSSKLILKTKMNIIQD